MSRSCVRIDLCPSMCDKVALEWNHGGCMIIAEHGKHRNFRSMYSLIHADLLRFLVRDFQSDKKAHEHQAALRGWTCVLSGTCTFIGKQGIHVRAFTFKNDHGDDNVHYATEDEEGFWLSPHRVMATKIKITGEIIVVFADKSGGLGYHEMKAVDRHGNESIYKGHELL